MRNRTRPLLEYKVTSCDSRFSRLDGHHISIIHQCLQYNRKRKESRLSHCEEEPRPPMVTDAYGITHDRYRRYIKYKDVRTGIASGLQDIGGDLQIKPLIEPYFSQN